jgi:hypothetical protein
LKTSKHVGVTATVGDRLLDFSSFNLVFSIGGVLVGVCRRRMKKGETAAAKGIACTNNGCNSRFTEETNTATGCTHHPGVPVFHEGFVTF